MYKESGVPTAKILRYSRSFGVSCSESLSTASAESKRVVVVEVKAIEA